MLNLEESVDDLLASIWQYNLHNLSEQVLGFQEKMNQLKSQETIILRAHRQAQTFQETVTRVEDLIRILEDARNIADKTKDNATTTEQETRTILTRAQEQEQRVSALAAQAEQENSAASTQAANARAAAAEAQAIAERLPSIQADLASQQADITDVLDSTRKRSTEFETTSSSALKEFKALYEQTKNDIETTADELRTNINDLSSALRTDAASLVESTSERLEKAQREDRKRISDELSSFDDESRTLLEKLKAEYQGLLGQEVEKLEQHRDLAEKEHARLVLQLDELEKQIKDSIRRATGFSLFHSFQKRQEDLAASKRSWAKALAAVVVVSLTLSVAFIIYVASAGPIGPAFYLKLSVSLPLIYAIWFCSVQYSRERRLEEEYAFKSSISISLDPYRELVEKLVIKEKPEELAKYTAFIIESVGKVFTSPMEHAFPADGKDSSPIEGVIGSIKDLVTEVLRTKAR